MAPAHASAAAYHGKVVDAETKAPLDGAVVIVIWHRKPIITMDGPAYFHRAVEVLTNAEGRFWVDASPGIDWNPLTYVVRNPWIVIFKPGYGPFPVAHVSPRYVIGFRGQRYELNLAELNRELLKGAVVELPKLKTTTELQEFAFPVPVLISTLVPLEKVPNFMRLLNVHRRAAGLGPYPASEGGPRR